MDLGLKGLKALVTGGTKGIGRAVVDLLAAEGADIALCARNEAEVAATKGLSHQLAGKGIRVNALSPGNTYFPGGVWEKIETANPELYKQALALNPTGRMAHPDEIARGVVFLASPAASFITGTNLVVDGALTRGVQY